MADTVTEVLEKNALTTLETMLDFLGLSGNEDPVIQNTVTRLINSASAYIESMTGRQFAKQEYIETHSAGGGQELCLDQYPIIAVSEIIDTASDQKVTAESYDHLMDGKIGVIYRDRGWIERGYRGGLANDIMLRSRYLKVCYVAGYILPKDATKEEPATLPYDLQSAVWQMVQQQWTLAANGATGLAAFSISDISWTFDKTLPAQVTEIIQRYMRWS